MPPCVMDDRRTASTTKDAANDHRKPSGSAKVRLSNENVHEAEVDDPDQTPRHPLPSMPRRTSIHRREPLQQKEAGRGE
jgi:hypothetical protein